MSRAVPCTCWAAMVHGEAAVIAQQQVDSKSNEDTRVPKPAR